MSKRILVVEDDTSMIAMLETGLGKQGHKVISRESADEAFELIGEQDFDVIVTDLNMRGLNGIELCERVVANRPDTPVIVITAFGSLDTAIAAIRAGAYDFIPKPFDMTVLKIALDRAIQHRALGEEVKRLRLAVGESAGFEEIVGRSPAMQKVFELLDRVAGSTATALITGESGSGKELVARALHRKSPRSDGPFVAVDCTALPETLLESELFGHSTGAFTDAKTARTGLFVQANNGTLFLDEIGEMPLSLQPKLLRALQERKVRPVGSNIEVPFDARVVAATNRDLETAVEERRFREDLFYRVNVIRITVPPLRARRGDVLLLAQHFLQMHAASSGKNVVRLSSSVAERLLAYSWPGNIRELQNCIERAVALARYEEITVEDLPEHIRNYSRAPLLPDTDDPSELPTMEEVERRYILRALKAAGGNKTMTAQILGLDRRTLYRKLERFGLTKVSEKRGSSTE